MPKTLENFIKELKKLENYFILREEDEYFIIGTKIIIKEHKEILGNVFQPFSKNIDKEIAVFFMLSFHDSNKQFEIFLKNHFPVFLLHPGKVPSKKKEIKRILDQFIQDTYFI